MGALQTDSCCLAEGQPLSSLIISLQKIQNYGLPAAFNLVLYSISPSKDSERLDCFDKGRLSPPIAKPRLSLSITMINFIGSLTLSQPWAIDEEVILEHKSICPFHLLTEESRQ